MKNQGLCGVCRCMDAGNGLRQAGKILWVCDDPECLDIGKRSANVRQNEFNRLEAQASIEGGGNAMGAFLDEAGFGHLFDGMPAEVWAEACKRGTAGYRTMLKKLVDENAAPF